MTWRAHNISEARRNEPCRNNLPKVNLANTAGHFAYKNTGTILQRLLRSEPQQWLYFQVLASHSY